MVESVDKRDERTGRTGGAEPGSVREATAPRSDDTSGDMSEKQTVALGSEGDEAREGAGPNAGPDAQPPSDPAEVELRRAAATDLEPHAAIAREAVQGARVIPFVPRGGVVRATPLPVQVEPRFARPAAGPAAYAGASEGGFSLPPAQPPPPSGFRRTSGWVREDEPQPLPQSPVVGDGDGGGFGHRVRAAYDTARQRLARQWTWRRALKYAVVGLAALLLAYASLVVVLIVAYRWIDPPASSLMLSQRLSGTAIEQAWTPIDRISPNLLQAVILSEDGQFCRHRGVDWLAMKEAIEQSLDGNARGGSTISMQTVKNLFLWPSKSYLRKAIELPLAMGTELVWPKSRMLELYLNIAEWGPGIFGAEAAARHHFGKSAAYLTAREASLLAVALPNPIDRQAGAPSASHQRLADRLQARMRRVPNAASCVLAGRGNRAAPPDPAGQRRNLGL